MAEIEKGYYSETDSAPSQAEPGTAVTAEFCAVAGLLTVPQSASETCDQWFRRGQETHAEPETISGMSDRLEQFSVGFTPDITLTRTRCAHTALSLAGRGIG
jgi:hypothetical protein